MDIVLQRDAFIKDRKGMSLFYYILQALNIPMKDRDFIKQIDVKVASFEAFKSKYSLEPNR